MHKNKLWLLLLFIVALGALWYTLLASYRYYNYSRLDIQAAPSTISWHVVEHRSDAFTLMAKYAFVANGQQYFGSTDLSDDTYLNYDTAEKSIPHIALLPWKVWYDEEHPNHSSLQKHFPFKEYIYAIILWGIFLYFIWLGFYVSTFKT